MMIKLFCPNCKAPEGVMCIDRRRARDAGLVEGDSMSGGLCWDCRQKGITLPFGTY